ncbi:hypothetical protein, partial [Aeromonas taiwanensis]|uniref:hypothetical protein n=1 Tax=Aeromonas taiwanensis TaxID=633417 RepID=UPI00248DB4F4
VVWHSPCESRTLPGTQLKKPAHPSGLCLLPEIGQNGNIHLRYSRRFVINHPSFTNAFDYLFDIYPLIACAGYKKHRM